MILSIVLILILIIWCIVLVTLSCLGSKRVGFLSGKHFIQPENTKGKSSTYSRPFIVRVIFILFGLLALASCALLITRGSGQYDETVESFRNDTLVSTTIQRVTLP